jgi:DNA gyrase inhibitor GyrI
MDLKELEVRIEKLPAMQAAYVCSFDEAPKEEAGKRILKYAKNQNLMKKPGVRLFGRTTYPTDKSNTHGYELYLTIGTAQKGQEIETAEIRGGLYAVLRFKNLENIDFGWRKLWNWIETSGYEPVSWQMGKNGWIGGFEEHVNWQDQKGPAEWVYDLWVLLKG